jgi:hypothetical protein
MTRCRPIINTSSRRCLDRKYQKKITKSQMSPVSNNNFDATKDSIRLVYWLGSDKQKFWSH